ncbi:PTS galactitol transporter subunit IIC [Anaerofustis stercorihominis]|uniref:PTS system Galactitol-specific IIC component n=4 Tax=Anaerofustis stercorihominis TaxID=214853 RepID=B1C8U0_9FIRM|nr:PTS transporter subunit IIC [Anaerofustis stercorihominis]EDS72000.1 PTS system Galactitol-specific IIC component [Anaerofustis stercorihominis DSM 17244]MCQ4795949.1 PTS galactitol transporter subunit IIC [Anaerofustis stercorihominis]RGD74956.1 PTS galactitol transporter subunit IIC [Anaerofustis stercorihominis]
MSYILGFFDILSNLGASVMMPIIIFVIALCLGTGFGKALKSGLTMGVAFIGINLVINLLGNTIGPAAQQMVENLNLNLNILDVGWPTAAQIAFSTKVGAIIIPVCLLVNVVMLIFNLTQTADIDIWNFWQLAFTGSLVAIVTSSVALGLLAAVCEFVIALVLADLTADKIAKVTKMDGISFPHTMTVVLASISFVVDKIIDKIPGLNKIDINAKKMEEKLGVLGDPLIIGFVIGLVIGILAYGIKAYDKYLLIAITLGATLVLIPAMAKYFGESLTPISERAQVIVNKKFKNRGKIYIGMDAAVALGNSTTIATALILTPIIILLALIVPHNQFLPFADLGSAPYIMALIVPMCNENAFRSLLIAISMMAIGVLLSTAIAPIFTQAALSASYQLPEGFSLVSCISNASTPLNFILVKVSEILRSYGAAIFFAVTSLVCAIANGIRIRKQVKKTKEVSEN